VLSLDENRENVQCLVPIHPSDSTSDTLAHQLGVLLFEILAVYRHTNPPHVMSSIGLNRILCPIDFLD
jgi:hypothetical protein